MYKETLKKRALIGTVLVSVCLSGMAYAEDGPVGSPGAPSTEVQVSAPGSAPASAEQTVTYVRLVLTSAHLRVSPGGDIWGDWEAQGAMLPAVGTPESTNGYQWWPVRYRSWKLYVRGDCVEIIQGVTTASTPDGAMVIPELQKPGNNSAAVIPPASFGTLRTVKSGVNIRVSPNGQRIDRVDYGTSLNLAGDPESVQGVLWYPVLFHNRMGYVRGDCVKVFEKAGSAETALDTQAEQPSSVAQPAQEIISDHPAASASGKYVLITGAAAPLRNTSSMKETPSGTVPGGFAAYLTGTVSSEGQEWYQVNYLGTVGYVPASVAKVITEVEYASLTAQKNQSPSAPAEAQEEQSSAKTLGTLKTVKKNVNVRTAPAAPHILGRVEKGITLPFSEKRTVGRYTWYYCSTRYGSGWLRSDCVKIQSESPESGNAPASAGLPAGTDGEVKIYPVEKDDWYTGDIQQLIPKGSTFRILDVKTGISWMAKRWSGGGHADIEPLTSADTKKLCAIYGVKTASEINARDHWQRRPCLVTVGTRTIACSLYGVPHNESGDTIQNNNLKGQLCLHFTGSTITRTGTVDKGHTAAIEAAYQYAQSLTDGKGK